MKMSKTPADAQAKAGEQAQLRRELLRLIVKNEARRQGQNKAATS
ncbi:MAG TPA: hypothetical protein VMF30_15960 [Pirellulales bacterium]|nr:hypothetical protein [Pirellulales bacterium]